MTIDSGVSYGIMMASWSLEEAAHYVHNLDPTKSKQRLSPKLATPISKTYYWLLKEFDRERIRPLPIEDNGEPRFIPGTILRHLDEKKQNFHKPILTAYLKYGIKTGPSDVNRDAKFIYQKAAAAIRKQHPAIRKTQAAKLLTQLPNYMGDNLLPSWNNTTIRKHLKDLWPGKSGRPPKGEDLLPDIDWALIIKKLI